MAKKKNNVTDMVEKILRNVPESRNSDIRLTIEIWKYFFPEIMKKGNSGNIGIWLEDMFNLPQQDSIKRARAAFNAEGKYFPTDWEVAKARGIKEDEWRVTLGYPAKAETVHPTKTDSYMDQQREFNSPKLF